MRGIGSDESFSLFDMLTTHFNRSVYHFPAAY